MHLPRTVLREDDDLARWVHRVPREERIPDDLLARKPRVVGVPDHVDKLVARELHGPAEAALLVALKIVPLGVEPRNAFRQRGVEFIPRRPVRLKLVYSVVNPIDLFDKALVHPCVHHVKLLCSGPFLKDGAYHILSKVLVDQACAAELRLPVRAEGLAKVALVVVEAQRRRVIDAADVDHDVEVLQHRFVARPNHLCIPVRVQLLQHEARQGLITVECAVVRADAPRRARRLHGHPCGATYLPPHDPRRVDEAQRHPRAKCSHLPPFDRRLPAHLRTAGRPRAAQRTSV
mmetsp:Transcript_3764/g.11221  ORF Transcript_3764/g.11221 Transcript_3764/m.11221 type:complete len:290 (-) Transcript_3764:85-954(-)